MNNIVISLKNLSKSFDEKQVLKSLDFEIHKGMIVGLLGKNGAGKSTLIKCLLGLLRPDEGRAQVLAEDSFNISSAVKQRIGYVPQTMTGFRWMRIETMLEYTGSFYSKWNEKKVNTLLKEWDLDPWTKISALSEGERQKLSIIQAMGHEPDIFIFDEPVASLDPAARRKFIKQLIELNLDENKTMLFSTHITSDLERAAAEIAFLKDGQIALQGDLASIKEKIKRLHIRSLKELPEQLPIKNVLHSNRNHNSAVLTVNGIDDLEIEKMKEQFGADISVENLNLEEIFLELNR